MGRLASVVAGLGLDAAPGTYWHCSNKEASIKTLLYDSLSFVVLWIPLHTLDGMLNRAIASSEEFAEDGTEILFIPACSETFAMNADLQGFLLF